MNATAPIIDTKTRILDAAERIFSQDGFDAASLRTITTAAQVNLAAVNYHFHSKEALFSAVIERRLRPINLRRLQMLDSLGSDPAVEMILEAFLRPPMEVATGNAEVFRPLMARLHSVPGELIAKIYEENFASIVGRFVDAMSTALPEVPREELQWRMLFLVGSMSHALAWSPKIKLFTGGECSVAEHGIIIDRLVSFGAAGLRGPVYDAGQSSKRVSLS